MRCTALQCAALARPGPVINHKDIDTVTASKGGLTRRRREEPTPHTPHTPHTPLGAITLPITDPDRALPACPPTRLPAYPPTRLPAR
jgi:hypothetical protein